MVRIILGVIVGFIVWSIVWLGSAQTLESLSPDWFGRYALEAERAINNNEPMPADHTLALINLIRSFLTSLIAGYMAALIAGEYRRSTMALGVLLVVVGIAFEYFAWHAAPAWYHVLFVLFLLPMTIVGGRLRRSS